MAVDKIFFIDLETENHKFFGALASPRHPDNYVVAVGTAIDQGPVETKYYYSKTEAEAGGFLHIPDDVWLLVAHNAPFEMDWFLVKHRAEIGRFLARGGRIFCTAYAEYLLTNQQETYPALDVVAPKYGGTHKIDEVKLLWEQGYLTSQIDKDLLLEYLGGPNGDIENTRKVFYGQYLAAVARGMWEMMLVRMEGLIFNCFSMDSGLNVDRDTAFKQLEQQNEKLAELSLLFGQYRSHIPDYVDFKESSDYQMSAWLFGGPIKYRIRDTWFEDDGVTPKYEKFECYKFGDVFIPIANINAGIWEDENGNPQQATPAECFEFCVRHHGAVDRYSAGKNKGQPKTHKVDSSTPKQKWYDRIITLGPLIDLDKLPKDIRNDFKQEYAGKRKLADDSPVYSTGKEAIEMLSKRQEFDEGTRNVLTQLLTFAKIDKDVGTYYLREESDEEGNVVKQSGMLQYLTPWGIVYHVLNATATVTTRLSSNRPNMQNIPRGDTSEVKRMFSSRFDNPLWITYAMQNQLIDIEFANELLANINAGIPNGNIIEADYSALEVVTLAAFSKDPALVQALLDGTDMHCMRLAKKLGEGYESVLQKCKDDDHPEHPKYKTMRTDIKPRAFAYQYGATAAGIAFATGCTVEEAQEFIDTEKALFPGVEFWYENGVFTVIDQNTTVHREQKEDGSYRAYRKGVWQSPGGTCYEFREFPKVKYVDGQRYEIMEFKPTQMRNYPIQGESGYFVQGIAGLVVRWLISENFFGGRVWIINQVHDALYLDVHLSVRDEVARKLKEIMESLPQYFNRMGYDLQVPFPAEVEAGPNMLKKGKVC